MVTVTINIFGPGDVHAYKQRSGQTTWIDLGVVTQSNTPISFDVNDHFRFSAEPPLWGILNKFCDSSYTNCVTTQTFEGVITSDGAVNAYFDWNYFNIGAGVGLAITGYLAYKYKDKVINLFS